MLAIHEADCSKAANTNSLEIGKKNHEHEQRLAIREAVMPGGCQHTGAIAQCGQPQPEEWRLRVRRGIGALRQPSSSIETKS